MPSMLENQTRPSCVYNYNNDIIYVLNGERESVYQFDINNWSKGWYSNINISLFGISCCGSAVFLSDYNTIIQIGWN